MNLEEELAKAHNEIESLRREIVAAKNETLLWRQISTAHEYPKRTFTMPDGSYIYVTGSSSMRVVEFLEKQLKETKQ